MIKNGIVFNKDWEKRRKWKMFEDWKQENSVRDIVIDSTIRVCLP